MPVTRVAQDYADIVAILTLCYAAMRAFIERAAFSRACCVSSMMRVVTRAMRSTRGYAI